MDEEDLANLLVRQFENTPRRSWWENKKDDSSRLKFVEDCIRLVGVFERVNKSRSSGYKRVSGLEETLSAIQNGEEMLLVRDVNSDDVKVISEELKTNTSLLWLDFSYCKIGDEEAEHLSDALRENCTLLCLDIRDNRIGPEGARHLSDMLRENSTLLYLDIRNNQIGPEGARHLSDMLRENSTLLYLRIGNCNIGPEGARYLSDMLRENSTLLYLDMSHCNIGPEGARHLSDMLRENSTLLYLHLRNNQIGPEGARNLSDMLRENRTLLYLHLWVNQIGPEGARHLSDALRENSTLLYLNIQANGINNKQLEDQIKNEIQSRTSSSNFKQRSFDECRAYLQDYFEQLLLLKSESAPSSTSGPSSSSSTSLVDSSNLEGRICEEEIIVVDGDGVARCDENDLSLRESVLGEYVDTILQISDQIDTTVVERPILSDLKLRAGEAFGRKACIPLQLFFVGRNSLFFRQCAAGSLTRSYCPPHLMHYFVRHWILGERIPLDSLSLFDFVFLLLECEFFQESMEYDRALSYFTRRFLQCPSGPEQLISILYQLMILSSSEHVGENASRLATAVVSAHFHPFDAVLELSANTWISTVDSFHRAEPEKDSSLDCLLFLHDNSLIDDLLDFVLNLENLEIHNEDAVWDLVKRISFVQNEISEDHLILDLSEEQIIAVRKSISIHQGNYRPLLLSNRVFAGELISLLDPPNELIMAQFSIENFRNAHSLSSIFDAPSHHIQPMINRFPICPLFIQKQRKSEHLDIVRQLRAQHLPTRRDPGESGIHPM